MGTGGQSPGRRKAQDIYLCSTHRSLSFFALGLLCGLFGDFGEIMVGVGELGGGTGLLPTPTREGEYLLEALSLHHTLGCPGM